jgi:hypothetical protein
MARQKKGAIAIDATGRIYNISSKSTINSGRFI